MINNAYYWRVTFIFPSNKLKGRVNDSATVPYEVAKTEEEVETFFKSLPVFNGSGRLKEVAEIIKIEEINHKAMENIISYVEFLNEDGGASGGGAAMAGGGTTSGMGNVASAQPASTPGATVTGDGTTGSGDYGNPLFPTANKDGSNTIGKKKGRKKDKKKESVVANFIAQYKGGKSKKGSTTSDDGTISSKMLSFSDFVNNDIKK